MITTPEVELLVVNHFNPRANVIVPNVFWGLGLQYEVDLVVLRPSGYAIEIEIKVSRNDLKAEDRKRHTHNSMLFRELWFAVPIELADDPHIPSKAGILAVETRETEFREHRRIRTIRRGKLNRHATRWPEEKCRKLLELGVMRIWTLKSSILNLKTDRRSKKGE